jgi:fatty acid synthase
MILIKFYIYLKREQVHGDLSTLCWIQSKIPLCNENNDLINVVYSSLNFKDIMITTGRLVDFLTQDVSSLSWRTDEKYSIGFEFTGFNSNGQRIMGMCQHG